MRKLSDQQWLEYFRKFKNSGLSKKQFSKKHGLPLSQFYKWAHHLAPDLISTQGNTKKKLNNDSSFLEINKNPINELSITLGDKKIGFSKLPDPSWVAAFISGVQDECSEV